MPKGGKKKDINDVSFAFNEAAADITLDDFANLKVMGKRLKKPARLAFIRSVKHPSSSDFGIDSLVDNDLEADAEEERSYTDFRSSRFVYFDEPWPLLDPGNCTGPDITSSYSNSSRSKPEGARRIMQSRCRGRDYPLDIWFLLGDYIKPEDINTFATICKKSLYVVSTYKFWICLYKRYYKETSYVPDSLRPLRIQRPHLIKFNVVRALYHFYPPFLERKKKAGRDEVDSLIKLRCTKFWYSQDAPKSKWHFFFKFQERASKDGGSRTGRLESGNRLESNDSWEEEGPELMEDTWQSVTSNPEEGCHILNIGTNHYVSVSPDVMGRKLDDVRITLTGNLRKYKILLIFNRRVKGGKGDSVHIEVEPADSIQVFRWWHPNYPISS